MSQSPPVRIRLDTTLNDRVDSIAMALDRPKSRAIEQFVKDFAAMQEWLLEAIDAGLGAADEGRFVDHRDVTAWVKSLGEADERPMLKCE
jgi:predicted transcriptional regulator